MGSRSVTYIVPGPEEREFWEFSVGKGEGRRKNRVTSAPSVYCFGAVEVFAVPLWVGSSDPEVIKGAVSYQLESRRLIDTTEMEGAPFDYLTVKSTSTNSQVLGLILSKDSEDYQSFSNLRGFDLSPRLYRLPQNGGAIWKESGQYIFAVNRNGKLAYFQGLSGRQIDSDLISEILCIKIWLEGAGFIDGLESIEVFDPAVSSGDAALIATNTGVPTQVFEKPAPRVADMPTDIIPHGHAVEKQKEKQRQRLFNILFVGMLVYLAIVGVVLWDLIRSQKALENEAGWIANYEFEAKQIKDAQNRWYALQPAIDKNYYPLENFKSVVEALPGENVRLTRFQSDLENIKLEGVTSDTNGYLLWSELLPDAEKFEDYTWNFAKSIRGEKVTFTAGGTKN